MAGSDAEVAPVAEQRAACPTCQAVFRGAFRRCPNDGGLLVAGGPDPLVGTVLAERYQIEAVIGDGGLGRVYRARHVRMARRFAIKVPFGEVAYDRKARARLVNEAEAASRLDHPNVIGVVDVGETPAGLFYLAMDLADGHSLADELAGEPLSIVDVLALLEQLVAGLAHAHERGLVHRDLKPDNVVVSTDADGEPLVRVIDFGLALVDSDGPATRLTTEGMVVGTPYYMAPEQAMGGALDFRTDLFALGIIVFEMLAGQLPFDGGAVEVARQNTTTALPTIAARSGREVDPLLQALVTWLTARRAADRPQATSAVLGFVRELADGDRAAAAARLPAAAQAQLAGGGQAARGDAVPTLDDLPEARAADDVAEVVVPAAVAAPAPTAARLSSEESVFDGARAEATPRPDVAAPAPRRSRAWAVVVGVAVLALGGALAVSLVGRGGGPASRVSAPPAPVAAAEPDAGLTAGRRSPPSRRTPGSPRSRRSRPSNRPRPRRRPPRRRSIGRRPPRARAATDGAVRDRVDTHGTRAGAAARPDRGGGRAHRHVAQGPVRPGGGPARRGHQARRPRGHRRAQQAVRRHPVVRRREPQPGAAGRRRGAPACAGACAGQAAVSRGTCRSGRRATTAACGRCCACSLWSRAAMRHPPSTPVRPRSTPPRSMAPAGAPASARAS
ncbi:MAG: serine/threonine-protein kinase [Kofleriaceae bacterium]